MSKQITTEGLRKLNLVIAVLCAAQGIALLFLAKPFFVAIYTNFLTRNDSNGVLQSATSQVFDFNLVWLIAVILFVFAIMRVVFATNQRKMYEADLKKMVNRERWAEYAVVGSLLMLATANLIGITDLTTLLLLLGLNAGMAFAAIATEVRVQANKRYSRWHFWLTEFLGKFAWLGILIYVIGTVLLASKPVPWYCYSIVVSVMLLMFAGVMINFCKQIKKKGKWNDLLFAERNHLILMFLAMTALTVQLYIGALR